MIVIDDIPTPAPGIHELIVEVAAAGVGPWDALVRTGAAQVSVPLPIVLGAEVSGVVRAIGRSVAGFAIGDTVYGATNTEFYGGYAQFALATSATLAPKPRNLSHTEAASTPVVAVTAWQMVFEYAKPVTGQTVLIHGAGGNVGAYAVQLARRAGLEVFATASGADIPYVKGLGATHVIDYRTRRFEDAVPPLDIVLDTVGGNTRERSYGVLKPGGVLVSVVTPFPKTGQHPGVREAFFIAEITTAKLEALTNLFDRGELHTHVGSVLPLEQARDAHEMLAGKPHAPGKLVLAVNQM